MTLATNDFDYNLPKELIAQYPLKQRDAARMLVLNRENQTLLDKHFYDILEYLLLLRMEMLEKVLWIIY